MDPIQLPSELTSTLFSLLRTNQIAKCTAVSKEWRNVILTDSIANRVLDLTYTRKTLTELETIQLVHRLASLSSHPQKEIRLDITPFLQSLLNQAALQPGLNIADLMRRTDYSFPSLISTISSATRGNLAKLSLESHGFRVSKSISGPFIPAVVETALILDKSIKDLREIQISLRGTAEFSLVSEGSAGDGRPPRRASVEGVPAWRTQKIKSSISQYDNVIQAINNFTGGGLKSLTLPHEKSRQAATRFEKLTAVKSFFNTVETSKNTLTDLSLGVLVDHDDFNVAPQPGFFLETWNFVKSCSSLEKLKLSVYSTSTSVNQDDQREEIVDLIIPQDQEPGILQLKELYLSMTGVRLSWESKPLYWIGTSLKILDLNFGSSKVFFENISRSLSDGWVVLLNSNPNLQTVKLSYVKSRGSSTRLVLPELTSLELDSVDLEGHGLFFDADVPKLESLKVNLRNLLQDGDLVEEARTFDHFFFLPILQSCQSALRSLEIRGKLDLNATFFQKERYRFTQLQILRLYSTSTNVVDLLSHSHFPRLKDLQSSGTLVSPQAALKILASASSSLEGFGDFDNSGRNSSATSFYYNHRCPQSSFPKLKSLTIKPATAFTKDLFLHATFGELKDLSFSLGRSSSLIPLQEVTWNDLVCLLHSNSSTLKFLEVNGSGMEGGNNFHGDQLESLNLEISLPELESMTIKSCSNIQILQFFQHLTFYKLSRLKVEVGSPISSKVQSELLNLMLRSSDTLVSMDIDGVFSSNGSGNVSTMGSYREKDERITDGKSIEFTLLTELFVSAGADLGFFSKLSRCSFPELEGVSVPEFHVETEDHLPLINSILKKLIAQSPKLGYLAVTDFEGNPIREYYDIKNNPDMIDEVEDQEIEEGGVC